MAGTSGGLSKAGWLRWRLCQIADLLSFRENPQDAKSQVRGLAHRKLEEIELHFSELGTLRGDLRLLTSLCAASAEALSHPGVL